MLEKRVVQLVRERTINMETDVLTIPSSHRELRRALHSVEILAWVVIKSIRRNLNSWHLAIDYSNSKFSNYSKVEPVWIQIAGLYIEK